MRRPAVRELLVLLGCAATVGAGLALLHVELPVARTLLWRRLGDLAHLPLFAAIGLALLTVSRQALGERISRRAHYLVALGVALLLGFGSETAQLATTRDADAFDALRNAIGATVGLLVAMAGDGTLARAPGSRARRRSLLAGAVGLLALSLVPLALAAEAYRQRDRRAPLLFGFESRWERPFIDTQGAWLAVEPAPPAWGGPERGRVGRVVFSPADASLIKLGEPFPDWRSAHALVLDTFSSGAGPVRLSLIVRDADPDRLAYVRPIDVPPGAGRVEIPLDEIRTDPRGRALDLARVRAVTLVAYRPAREFTVFLDEVRLVRAGADGAGSEPPGRVVASSRTHHRPQESHP